jgi:hypothetical protein
VRREGEVFVIDIALQSPVTGEQAIDFSYRLPRAQGAAARLVPATLLDDATRPAEADQFVAVLQSSAALITAGAADGLVPAEAESLPFLPGGVPAASLRPVYRATRADWSLEIEERVIEVARSGALVELAELTTVIGGDGIARTRAHYTVRNRGLQFLSVEMPEGSTLWGVELNGRPAAVGRGAAGSGGERRIRVPLEYVGSASPRSGSDDPLRGASARSAVASRALEPGVAERARRAGRRNGVERALPRRLLALEVGRQHARGRDELALRSQDRKPPRAARPHLQSGHRLRVEQSS